MLQRRKEIDWQVFWFRQILFLAVPLFIAVFTVPKRGGYVPPDRLAYLAVVLLGLSVLNIAWTFFEQQTPRKRAALHAERKRQANRQGEDKASRPRESDSDLITSRFDRRGLSK
jgi:hypothetical protein